MRTLWVSANQSNDERCVITKLCGHTGKWPISDEDNIIKNIYKTKFRLKNVYLCFITSYEKQKKCLKK